MKKHIHFVFGLSLMALALAGCGKQEKTEETAKPKEDVAQPVVSERPPVQCDDATIKNGVVSLVQNELLSASVSALGNAKNLPALEQHLKSRLAQTQVDVQNVRYENGDCHGELHIALNPQDATTADQAFAKAKLPSLDERAVSSGVSLLGGHRLVSKFAYVVQGDAVSIAPTDAPNPAITLASKALSEATFATVRQNQATARRDSGSSYQAPAITPPPVVRPAPVVRPVEPQQPQVQRRTPTPETAVLRPEDVPSREVQDREPTAPTSNEPPITAKERAQVQADQPKAETPKPKAEPKPEAPKAEPKAEAKPKAEPKAPAKDDSSEITIVESNETY